MKNRIIFVVSLICPCYTSLIAWEGKIFKVDGKNIDVYTESTASIRRGEKLYIMLNGRIVGEGKADAILHTKIKMRLIKGLAAKDYAVSNIRPAGKVNPENKRIDTALIDSAKEGNRDGVQAALKSGANINARDELGNTALVYVARSGDRDIVEFLLVKGADVKIKNMEGETAGSVSAPQAVNSRSHFEIFELIKKYWDGKSSVDLVAAVSAGNIENTNTALKAGANVNTTADSTYTPLISAACAGQAEIVKLLINAGADVNYNQYSDNVGMTALGCATQGRHIEIVKLLIEARVNVNAKFNGDRTARSSAESNDMIEIAELLVAAGAR